MQSEPEQSNAKQSEAKQSNAQHCKAKQRKAAQSNTNQSGVLLLSHGSSFGSQITFLFFSLSAPAGRGLFGMRAFFLPSRGDVNAPARSVEQPAASRVPSSLEQPADPFASINALTVWLKAQGDESSSPELRRLRAAVAVLAQKHSRKQADVRPLCSACGKASNASNAKPSKQRNAKPAK